MAAVLCHANWRRREDFDLPFAADGEGQDSFQALHAVKLVLLDNGPSDELIVYSLTNEGRLTGVPQYFSFGRAVFMRFDFKAGLLYAIAQGGLLRIFKLHDNGYPGSASQVFDLGCSDMRDALVDETFNSVAGACGFHTLIVLVTFRGSLKTQAISAS